MPTEPANPGETTYESTVEIDRTRVAPARWKWFLRLFSGIAVLVYLLARGDAATFLSAVRRVPFWVLIIGSLWYLGGQILSAWKWRLLLRSAGAKVSLIQCCKWYWLGMFSNLWLPGSVGGDAVRIWRLRKAGFGGGAATATVLVERLTGFGALLTLGACGLLFARAGSRVSSLVFVSLFAIVAIPAGFWLLRSTARPRLERISIGRKLLSVADAMALYSSHGGRGALIASIVISFVFQASQILLGIGLAQAVGLELATATFIWLVPLLALASLVPVGIGGLGVREAAAVALVGAAARPETVFAWSLLWQATVWFSSLPGALWLSHEGTVEFDRT